MLTSTRIGAGALSAALASGAFLSAGAGAAFGVAACDPDAYPPVQCDVVGGNRSGAPPLEASVTSGPPGTPVTASASGACNPGASVGLSLVRMSTGAEPARIGTATANSTGGFTVAGAIPGDSLSGSYVLYAACQLGTVISVSTTSFVVTSPSGTASVALRAGSPSSAGTTTGTTTGTTSDAGTAAAAESAALQAAALPETWTPPASWSESSQVKAAVQRAVNLRLAAMRSAVPAAQPAVLTPRPASGPDATTWFGGATGAAFLLAGAALWRRKAAASTLEVS